MAHNPETQAGELTPMSELSKYKIEPGDPDPRGWHLVGSDGAPLGTVVDLLVDTGAMKVRQLLVDVGKETGDRSLIGIDVADVDVRTDSREVFARGHAGAAFDAGTATPYTGGYSTARPHAEAGEGRLTRTEEELRIGKREVARGEARVGKHVETEHVTEPVTRRREEVVIERRPVSAGSTGDRATIGDAEVRIPLMEEEVIVEKRPVVKEELVVGKRVVEEREVVEAEVRKEQFDIDNQTTREREGQPSGRSGRSS